MPPPTPVAVGDVIQVTIEMRYNQQVYLNVLHYQSQENFSPALYESTLNTLLDTLETDAVTGIIEPYQAIVTEAVEFRTLTAQRVYPTRDYYVRVPVNVFGTYDGTQGTGNIGATISKRSQAAGRGRTGSFHTPALPAEGQNNGSLTTIYRGLVEDVASAIRFVQVESGAGTGFVPGMFNPALGGPNNFVPLIGTDVQPTVRVMRRRTVGVGI